MLKSCPKSFSLWGRRGMPSMRVGDEADMAVAARSSSAQRLESGAAVAGSDLARDPRGRHGGAGDSVSHRPVEEVLERTREAGVTKAPAPSPK